MPEKNDKTPDMGEEVGGGAQPVAPEKKNRTVHEIIQKHKAACMPQREGAKDGESGDAEISGDKNPRKASPLKPSPTTLNDYPEQVKRAMRQALNLPPGQEDTEDDAD